jgi:type 1 glutamine amidotransferase
MHQGDELYATLRGPGKNMNVLATAYSNPANSGTGRDEPMLMALSWGKGRIFHTTLGHDVNALSSVDFVVTFSARRGMGGDRRRDTESAFEFSDSKRRQLPDGPRGNGSTLQQRSRSTGPSEAIAL